MRVPKKRRKGYAQGSVVADPNAGTPATASTGTPAWSDYSSKNVAYYTDPNADFSGRGSLTAMGVKSKTFTSTGTPIPYDPTTMKDKVLYSADAGNYPTNDDGTPQAPSHVQAVMGSDGKLIYLPMYSDAPAALAATPKAPAADYTLSTSDRQVPTAKNAPEQTGGTNVYGGSKYNLSASDNTSGVTDYFKTVKGVKYHIAKTEYDRLAAAQQTSATTVPAKKKGGYIYKADGGEVPDISMLSQEQLQEYRALTTPEDQAAYLDKINNTGMLSQKAGKIGKAVPYAALGTAASKIVDNNVNVDMSGLNGKRNEMFKSAASTGLQRAGQGAQLGSLFGPEGTLIGAGLGLAEGEIEGAIKGKKKYNLYNTQRIGDAAATAAQGQYTPQPAADGGKIKGPGTGKSDSIPADVKPGSFIVPVENAKTAEKIHKKYFGPAVKANLDQDYGRPVKLSNGEFMFSPEQDAYLKTKGVDLTPLAPNAEKTGYGYQKGGPVGYKDGGGVGAGGPVTDRLAEIKQRLADLDAQYKVEFDKSPSGQNILTMDWYKSIDQERTALKKEQTALNSKYGLQLDAIKAGGAVPIPVLDDSDIKAAAPVIYQPSTATSATTTDAGAAADPNVITQKGDKLYNQLGQQIDATTGSVITTPKKAGIYGETATTSSSNDIDAATQQFLQEHNQPAAATSAVQTTATDAGGKTATGVNPVDALKKQWTDLMAAGKVVDAQAVENQMKQMGYGYKYDPVTKSSDWVNMAGTSQDMGTASDVSSSDAAETADAGATTDATTDTRTAAQKVFSGLGGYAGLAAIAQTGIGAAETIGKKPPVDVVDPTMLQRQKDAIAESKYGLSDDEMAVAKTQNEMNRRSAIYNVSNYSGGDAGLAVAGQRSVNVGANQANQELAAESNRIRLLKQDRADNLSVDVANRRRQIYEDKLSEFDKHQLAGADLMQAGLTNYFGNLNYQKQLMYQQNRDKSSEINFDFGT